MHTKVLLRFGALSLLSVLAGCESSPDPMLKQGTWSLPPAGLDANSENLRTMLVNPNDLVAGAGEATSNATESAQPVQRLLTGHRYPLPTAVGSVNSAPQSSPPTGTEGGLGAGAQ